MNIKRIIINFQQVFNMKKIVIIIFLFLTFPLKISAESFTWPTSGYIGWRYYTDTAGQEGIDGTYHTGIDIWGREDGSWNDSNGGSNSVYATYNGQVIYVDSLGLIVKHSDSLYTKYWHVKDITVGASNNVDSNTLLGYQDMAGGAVHLHLTIASSAVGSDANSTLDPSPYFGIQLDIRQPDVVPWGYKVEHQNRVNMCDGISTLVINSSKVNFNCSVNQQILLINGSKISGESRLSIN